MKHKKRFFASILAVMVAASFSAATIPALAEGDDSGQTESTQAAESLMPVIDASSVKMLEDFSVSQSTIASTYENALLSEENAESGMRFRISYNNAANVSIADGMLEMQNASGSAVSFIFSSNTSVTGDYLVLKVSNDYGPSNILSNARVRVGNDTDTEWTDLKYSSAWYAGDGIATALTDSTNPYVTTDSYDMNWYYIVIDVAATFGTTFTAYAGVDLRWTSSEGTLYVDEIFFANKLSDGVGTLETVEQGASAEIPTLSGSSYKGTSVTAGTGEGVATVMRIGITPTTSSLNLAGVRIQFYDADGNSSGPHWLGGTTHSSEGYLYNTDGTLLANLSYPVGETTYVDVDLSLSNVSVQFTRMTVHRGGSSEYAGDAFQFEVVSITYEYYDTEVYQEQLALLDNYLDSTAPTVSIDMSTTANVGDTITVEYTAEDDTTATEDLDITINVTKDGEPVTLDDNNSFVAEEGVYTIFVYVRDIAGNQGSDAIQVTVTEATVDTGTGDTSTGDTGTGDTGTGDTGTGDTSTGDTSTGDTSTGDTSTGDTSTGDTSTGDTDTDDTSDGLSAGAIAGIVISAIVVVAAVVIVAVVLVKRKNSRS